MLKKLILNGKIFDYTLIFNEQEFKLHKHVIDSKMTYFNNIHNNTFNDSNTTHINFDSICPNIINNKHMTLLFDNLIRSIYNDTNIFDKCNFYSFEEFVELTRMIDYFGYTWNKDIFFDLFENHYIKQNKNEYKDILCDKSTCYKNGILDNDPVNCTYTNSSGDKDSCSHICHEQKKTYICYCKSATKYEENQGYFNFLNSIDPFINFEYGCYLLNIFDKTKYDKIIPYLILTPEYIMQYNKIIGQQFMSKLLTCFTFGKINEYNNYDYFNDVVWTRPEFDEYNLSEICDDNNDHNITETIMIYKYYNNSCININNYKIMVNKEIMMESCNNFKDDMSIITEHNIDAFVIYIKYIYFGNQLDELDNLDKCQDFIYFYKFMGTNKCIDIEPILAKYIVLLNNSGFDLYKLLDYYCNHNYILEYIELFIRDNIISCLKSTYGNPVIDEKYFGTKKKCRIFVEDMSGKHLLDMPYDDHCKCTILHNKVKRHLFTKCVADKRMDSKHMYMLLYILRGYHNLILCYSIKGNFVIEDLLMFPEKYQPFIARIINNNIEITIL